MKEKLKNVTVVIKEKWSGFSNVVRVAICAVPVVRLS